MINDPRRISILGVALAALWVVVYWFWTPASSDQAPISFQEQNQALDLERTTPATSGAEGGRVSDVRDLSLVMPAAEVERGPGTRGEGAEEGRPIEHVVQRGETFESLAVRYFGSGRYVGALLRANSLKDPTRLKPGDVVFVPRDPADPQGSRAGRGLADAAGGADVKDDEGGVLVTQVILYEVQRGDTLSELAQRFYGSIRFSRKLFEANRDQLKSMDDLRPGQVLRIEP